MTTVILFYILFLSAKINKFFKKQKYVYMRLKSQVHELYDFAEDYLGPKQVSSEDPFLVHAIKQLRLKAKIIRIKRKLREIFLSRNKWTLMITGKIN